MIHIVLYQPQIPPNTGNVMRLCANSGATLHLIEPLAFDMDDTKLKRAGLDYREWADVRRHPDLGSACSSANIERLFAFTTKSETRYTDAAFRPGDGLLFGPETRGLPEELLNELGPQRCLRIPMQSISRSLNLANAVAIGLYEAIRQLDFPALD